MRSKTIIINALKRPQKRGLRVTMSNKDLSQGHLSKALHNLQVMDDLHGLQHSDWVAVVAYYAMYHAASAVLSHMGLESKEHAATVAVLEYFFSKEIDASLLQKFQAMKQKKDSVEQLYLDDKYFDYLWEAKAVRENAQYGTSTLIIHSQDSLNHAKEFVTAIRLLLDKLDEKYVTILQDQIQELVKTKNN